ncbi:MAG: hypothetical protein ACO36I_22380, partial [Candidatus Latescibacterota bacterium]
MADMNWDLKDYFPTFNGPEMVAFKEAIKKDFSDLHKKASELAVLNANNQDDWETVFVRYEDVMMRFGHINSYVGCLTSVDARNEDYAKEESALDRLGAEASKLSVELLRGLKDASDDVFDAFV